MEEIWGNFLRIKQSKLRFILNSEFMGDEKRSANKNGRLWKSISKSQSSLGKWWCINATSFSHKPKWRCCGKLFFRRFVCWWVKLKFSSKSQGYHNQQKMEIWWEKWAKVVILYHQRWTFVDQSIDFTKIQENSPATQQALPSNSKLWKLKLTNFPHWSLGFYGTKIKNEGVHQKLWWWSFHVRLKVVPPTWPKLYPGASRFLPRRHVLASAWRRRGAFPPVDITNVTPQVTNGFLLETN